MALSTPVQEVMSSPVVAATPDMSLDECCQRFKDNQIRRMPVVDESGACCGIGSQADIALHAPEHEVAEVLRDVSKTHWATLAAFAVGQQFEKPARLSAGCSSLAVR